MPALETTFSQRRLASSPGVQELERYPEAQWCPRMNKTERKYRLRGLRQERGSAVDNMRFAGIEIAAERHYLAIVNKTGAVLQKPSAVSEDAEGYRQLRELLGAPADCLVAMEVTRHYWRNVFTFLVAEGFSIALLNPLRARRFAEEDLQRTKTDAIDALGIARFAAQKAPRSDFITRTGSRTVARAGEALQLGDRVRHLHQAVDLLSRVHPLRARS